jgi:ABC-type sugar transport system ATPase subunit
MLSSMHGQTLAVAAVSKTFGATPALDDVSFTVAPGEILAVTGPSGSGKTTLCRVVSGLEESDAGTVALGGQDVTRMPSGQRRVAFVFESYALYPQLSVFDNVASPLRGPNASRSSRPVHEAINPVLELLEIPHLASRYPSELSGGQKQRVALARALVQRPSLFLLDEPIAHLDAKLRHKLRHEIRHMLKERSSPTIWTTPDGLEALSVADRVAVIQGGRLEQVGTPEEVWLAPASLRVARLIGDPPMNLIAGRLSGGVGDPLFECPSFAMRVHAPRLAHNIADVVLGVRPDRIELHPPSANATLAGEIYSHEPFGKYAVVSVRHGHGLIKIKTSSFDPLPIGAPIGVTIDPTGISIFDAQTERLVASAPPAWGNGATAETKRGTR